MSEDQLQPPSSIAPPRYHDTSQLQQEHAAGLEPEAQAALHASEGGAAQAESSSALLAASGSADHAEGAAAGPSPHSFAAGNALLDSLSAPSPAQTSASPPPESLHSARDPSHEEALHHHDGGETGPGAQTDATSSSAASAGSEYADDEGPLSHAHLQHQHQHQHMQVPQLHLHVLSSYEQHLLDFPSFHSDSQAQSTSADVLTSHHDGLSLSQHQHQHSHPHHSLQHQHQIHLQHQHQQHQQHQHQHHQHAHHHHHQLDSADHHHHHAALASSSSLTSDGLAGLAAHFQASQQPLPSLPPPLSTFVGMHHSGHHDGLPSHEDGSLVGGPGSGLGIDSSSLVGRGSGAAEEGAGVGAYAHLQHRQQHAHNAVPLYCICLQPYDGSSFMLACDHCNKWYHGKCVGIGEDSAKRGNHNGYVCPPCLRTGGATTSSSSSSSTSTAAGTGAREDMGAEIDGEGMLLAGTTTTTTTTMPSTSITGEKRTRDDDGEGEQESAIGGEMMLDADEGMADGEPSKKRRKSQLHQRGERLCRFPGCDKKITCRSYCSRHQKQKERCSKRGILFSTSSAPRKNGSIGRPSKTFSQTRNQRQKLKRFDEKLNDFAGGEQEGTVMLEKYLGSSYGQKRLPSTKGDKMSLHIGQNAIQLVNQLPPTSPLRKPLIKALGQGLSQSEIADTFHVSRKTVERSFALPLEENLLFSLVSRPRGMKPKSSGDVPLDAPLQVQLQQAGLYPPVPSEQEQEHLEVDLGHGLPASFTVEENGEISVSTQRPEDESVVGHHGHGSTNEASAQTHVLLQGNVVQVSMMDTDEEEDTTPLVFQGIAE